VTKAEEIRNKYHEGGDVVEDAVNDAFEWAAQQCEKMGDVIGRKETGVPQSCADLIRAGKSVPAETK